jgi:xylulose-5-phosphate/fructose-6-phosphate phosphoketolase
MDNPGLLVATVVGDGEPETGPLAGRWKSINSINPTRHGAVLPILHLNCGKISGPTVLGRHSDGDLGRFFEGQRDESHFVEGHSPRPTAAS